MTNSTTVSWVPEPQGRGTIGLVWSCFATILICVWNALHMNLPRRDDNVRHRVMRQARWVVVGLLAPEYLTLAALAEYEQAKKVQRRVSSRHCGW
jgi:hypothetical protein